MATITSGGSAQDALAVNIKRSGFCIQNQSGGDLYIREGADATATDASLKIAPGAYYESQAGYVNGARVSIIGATTGQAFFVREW